MSLFFEILSCMRFSRYVAKQRFCAADVHIRKRKNRLFYSVPARDRENRVLEAVSYTHLALDRLVAVSSIHYCTSTSALSTSSSSRGLTDFCQGDLISRGASRLDAFSVYPVPAWLSCYALGSPTGSPAAGPSRSSRTKDSSSQISCAHAG